MNADLLLAGFPIEDEDVRRHLAGELALALDDAYAKGFEAGSESRIKLFWKHHAGKFFAALVLFLALCVAAMYYLLRG